MPLEITDYRCSFYLYPDDNDIVRTIRCRTALQDALNALQPLLALQPTSNTIPDLPRGRFPRRLMLEAIVDEGLTSRVYHRFVPFKYVPGIDPLGTIIIADGLGWTIVSCLPEQRFHGYGL